MVSALSSRKKVVVEDSTRWVAKTSMFYWAAIATQKRKGVRYSVPKEGLCEHPADSKDRRGNASPPGRKEMCLEKIILGAPRAGGESLPS